MYRKGRIFAVKRQKLYNAVKKKSVTRENAAETLQARNEKVGLIEFKFEYKESESYSKHNCSL